MDISALIHQTLLLFTLILLAYFAQRFRFLPESTGRVISDLVINITNPCTILLSVSSGSRPLTNSQVVMFLGVTTALYLFYMALAIPVPRLLGAPRQEWGIYRFMTVFSNVGFLGIPVMRALLGPDAVFLSSMLIIVFTICTYTYGVMQVAGDPAQRRISPKLFFSPILIASYLAVGMYLLNWQPPTPVVEILSLMDPMTSPLAMLSIGCALALYPLKRILLNGRLYLFAGVKLILVPVLTWALLAPWLRNDLMLGVLVVSAAMPVATNTTLLANKYGGNVELGAGGVAVTTILSLLTLPVLLHILF